MSGDYLGLGGREAYCQSGDDYTSSSCGGGGIVGVCGVLVGECGEWEAYCQPGEHCDGFYSASSRWVGCFRVCVRYG